MKLDVFSLIVLLGALQALFFGIYQPGSNWKKTPIKEVKDFKVDTENFYVNVKKVKAR